jgi:hypothetical protein
MLPDFDDLHGIGPACLPDRLSDGHDDQVSIMHCTSVE